MRMAITGVGKEQVYQRNTDKKQPKAGNADFGSSFMEILEKTEQSPEAMMQDIRERMQEIFEKVKSGKTEPSIQIGAQSFTEKQWEKLMESFDDNEDALKKFLLEQTKQEQSEE